MVDYGFSLNMPRCVAFVGPHVVHFTAIQFFLGSIILGKIALDERNLSTPIVLTMVAQCMTFIVMSLSAEFEITDHIEEVPKTRFYHLIFSFFQTISILSFYYALMYTSLTSFLAIMCSYPVYFNFFLPSYVTSKIRKWRLRILRLLVVFSIAILCYFDPQYNTTGLLLTIGSMFSFTLTQRVFAQIRTQLISSDFILYGSLYSLPILGMMMMTFHTKNTISNITIVFLSSVLRAMASWLDVTLVQKLKVDRRYTGFRFFILITCGLVFSMYIPQNIYAQYINFNFIIGFAISVISYAFYIFYAKDGFTRDLLLYSIDIWNLPKKSAILHKYSALYVTVDSQYSRKPSALSSIVQQETTVTNDEKEPDPKFTIADEEDEIEMELKSKQ